MSEDHMSPETKEALEKKDKKMNYMIGLVVAMAGWMIAQNFNSISGVKEQFVNLISEMRVQNTHLENLFVGIKDLRTEVSDNNKVLTERSSAIDRIPKIDERVKSLEESNAEGGRWTQEKQEEYVSIVNEWRVLLEKDNAVNAKEIEIMDNRIKELEKKIP